MTATTTDDPVRAEVERRLRLIIDGALALPRGVQRRVDACVRRRLDSAWELIGAPLAMMRSLFDLVAAPAEPTVPTDDAEPVVAMSAGGGNDRAASAAAAGDLPIDEYESLAASQVVARLEGLSPTELRRVREFEAAHRGRRTVLGKVDQLLDA